jgi:sialate O-acetylesterase
MTAMARRPLIRYVKNARTTAREPRLDWKAVWRDYSPESFKATFRNNLSAIAFYYALELHDALGVPVGIIDSSWGGTRVEPWTPASGFDKAPSLPAKVGSRTPTALWNGMVAAFAPFGIKGFIWYQGCSNAGDGLRYCDKMHNLYDGWAKEFQNPDLKLYFVQLAPFSRSWFEVQLGQAKFAAEEKNAAMVTTCDIGNFWDIHPNDKESVARRLVLHALKRDYGFGDIVADAPELKSWKVDGDKFVMSFSNAGAWYAYNADRSAAQGFEIAGRDGKFVPARILNKGANGTLVGTELVVSAPGVKEPRRLRYLASKPWVGSLYSFDSGLPLGPFEIDARNPADGRRGGAAALGDALKVPELAGFRPVLQATLPAGGSFRKAGYTLDDTAKAGAFKRVAYVLELVCKDDSVDWAVAAMDAFTADASKLGVPAVTDAFFQQGVANLVVRSNRDNVPEGTFPEGGVIEFFNSNYAPNVSLAGLGGSDKTYDFNDKVAKGVTPGYGCMQVHNAKSGVTVFAYNNFNHGAADVGIGNNEEGDNPDWTFMGNARLYKACRLTVLVK